jgi:pilus assembly protein Flp/PilA
MKHLFREKGQGLVEYALILVLVAIVVIAVLLLLGPVIGNVFSDITASLLSPGQAGGGGGSTSTISDVRYGTPLGEFTIYVTVSENTWVSLSGSVAHSGKQCNGSCKFEFSSPPPTGSVTATASDGSTGSTSWTLP